MASAERVMKNVEVVRTQTVQVVQLELNSEEAQTLADILSLVGGFFSTRREHANAIADALEELGILFNIHKKDLTGELNFKEL